MTMRLLWVMMKKCATPKRRGDLQLERSRRLERVWSIEKDTRSSESVRRGPGTNWRLSVDEKGLC